MSEQPLCEMVATGKKPMEYACIHCGEPAILPHGTLMRRCPQAPWRPKRTSIVARLALMIRPGDLLAWVFKVLGIARLAAWIAGGGEGCGSCANRQQLINVRWRHYWTGTRRHLW